MFNDLLSFPVANVWVVLISVWALGWKGLALWKAARNDAKWWYVAILLINTLGVLEILYIYYFSKRHGHIAVHQTEHQHHG